MGITRYLFLLRKYDHYRLLLLQDVSEIPYCNDNNEMKFTKTGILAATLFAAFSISILAAQAVRHERNNGDSRIDDPTPTGKHVADITNKTPRAQEGDAKVGKSVVQGNGINYHGGSVLKGNPVNLYVIWYGNWSNGPLSSDTGTTVGLVDTFLSTLGGTGWAKIITTYGDTTGNVSGNLTLKNHVFDTGSQG